MAAGNFKNVFAHFGRNCPVCFERNANIQVLSESEVVFMRTMATDTGQYTKADVISLLQVISVLSKRIARRMQMTEAANIGKGGKHYVQDEWLISRIG